MAKFDRKKTLKRMELKRKWRNYSRYVYIAVPCVLCCLLCLYFAYSKFFISEEQAVIRTTVGDFIYGDVVIGAYIDGEYSSTIPGKNDGYVVDKVVCDNGAVGKWNNDNWGLLTTNLSKRSKCNVYFKKGIKIGNLVVSVDELGKCPTVNEDGSVNVTGIEATDGYLCSAKDAYGTSYYYRGNVTNNYVKFADKYWRIVRINGDGTVRVIYDGTSAHANGESSGDRLIGTTAFNNYWKKNNVKESTNSGVYYDNAGVGYMYGNRDGIVEQSTQYSTSSYFNNSTYSIAKEYNYNTSTDRFTLKNPIAVKGSDMTSSYVGYYTFNQTSSSYSYQYIYKITSVTADSSRASVGYKYVTYGTTSKEKAQTNTNSSDIKTYLDIWYENNIKGTTNEQYVADNIFCNDRSISSRTSSTYTNKGYGNEMTYYRLYNTTVGSYNNKKMLACPQKNDAFTVDDTTKGNGALTYSIGLLTADEVALAGGWNEENSGYYLYSGQDYWLASPNYFIGHNAIVRTVRSDGNLNASYVSFSRGTRPVLNLSSEILKNGNGTASDPYHA